MESPLKIAIQGGIGAYHNIAAEKFFSPRPLEILPCASFEDIFRTIESDSNVLGMLAIENTIAGSLLPNYELLRKYPFSIVGEYKLQISHVLATLPTTTSITQVMSHPIALMQCTQFLNQLSGISIVEHEDTALAARDVMEKQLHGCAVICSAYAASLYGLKIVAQGIETNKHNFTRFLVIANTEHNSCLPPLGVKQENKATVVFSLIHEQGSLSSVLSVLSFYKINLTKIQSTPIIGREWEYQFYVDFTFEDKERFFQALKAVEPLISELRILGVYPESVQKYAEPL